MAAVAEVRRLSSGIFKPRPLNTFETLVFKANRWRNAHSRVPKWPLYSSAFNPQTKEAQRAYQVAQQKVIEAVGRYDFVEESRIGTFSGLKQEVSQTSLDNLRSIKQDQPLIVAMSHPNDGVSQGEWVPSKIADLLDRELVNGSDRTFKVLMPGSRSYTGWLSHLPLMKAMVNTPGQILVNVAEIGDFILADSPRSTYSEVCQAVQRGDIVGIFPTLHAQRALTDIDLMLAKMCGRLGHEYGAMTLLIGASFWKGTYTLNIGEPYRYQISKGAPKDDVKTFASMIGYDLAKLLPFHERGRYNINPL